jgi:5-hydroxyisourate hydrolase-like protein (transthyretin family)
MMILLFFTSSLWASPTTSNQAQHVVKGWLAADREPLHSKLGQEISSVDTFVDSNGEPVYFVVYLEPKGFVIVPADDQVEPIICFVSGGSYDIFEGNPLAAMVSRDLPSRLRRIRFLEKNIEHRKRKELTESYIKQRDRMLKARNKWTHLQSYEQQKQATVLEKKPDLSLTSGIKSASSSLGSISDVRVLPLVQSQWSQETVCGMNCYNFYTPNKYLSGCVATAMAQLMRYHQYPKNRIGKKSFTIWVDGFPRTAVTRGGDGNGGPYNWDLMTLVPDCSTTKNKRKAIGALCYDAGISTNTYYTADWSAALITASANELVGTFGYSNAVLSWNQWKNIGSGLNSMVNPNLDAGYPVILGVLNDDDEDIGHAMVCDGYGYNSFTLYHHLNMGWGGGADAWYNLPDIYVDESIEFNVVDSCIYNIFKRGSGEIISGRVTDTSNNPIENVVVTGQSGSNTYEDTTDENGIYALKKIPSNSTYLVIVSDLNNAFVNRKVATGNSISNRKTSGNRWLINFKNTEDNFNDNQKAPMWKLYQTDSNNCWIDETNQQLQLRATGSVGDISAFYQSRSWMLDSTKDFSMKVDYYYDPLDTWNEGAVVLRLNSDTNEYVSISVLCFEDSMYFGYDDSDGSVTWENRGNESGTLYISYDAPNDILYFSEIGYGSGNALWTSGDLLQGEWGGVPLHVSIGGDSNSVQLDAGDAFLDNFIVNSGTVIEKILVNKPNINSQWVRGNSYKIRWTTDSPSPDVTIMLFKGNSKAAILKSSTANDGVWKWTVPNDLARGTDYRIKVACIEDKGVCGFSDYFEVLRPGDLYTPITVSEPNSNSVWKMGSTYPIQWSGAEQGSKVKIKLHKGKNEVKIIRASTNNDGNVSWNVPYSLSTGSNYKVKVISSDYSYVCDFSEKFEIAVPPINVTVPKSGKQWELGSKYPIKWTGGKPSENVKIRLLKGGSPVETITNSTVNDGLFKWMVPLTTDPGDDYSVRVIYLPDTTLRDASETFSVIDSL